MNKNLYFLSGLPRTGTTLLSSILNQNPKIHVSSTSGLLDFLSGMNGLYFDISKRYKIQDENQIKNLYRSVFNSWYDHIECPNIVDKWRGWINNIDQVREITGKNPKIIYTYRPIEEIATSFLYLIERDPKNFVDNDIRLRYKILNNETRFEYLWNEGVIGESYSMLENFYKHFYLNSNVLFLKYEDIVYKPKECLENIYNFLQIDQYDHDFNNIKSNVNDNDEYWKLNGLHVVREKLKINFKNPRKFLSKEAIDFCVEKNKIFEFLT